LKFILRVLNNTLFRSIRFRIILIITLFVFFPTFLLISFNFKYSENLLQEKISRLFVDNLRQIGNQIEYLCKDMIKLTNILNSNTVIKNNLSEIASGGDENQTEPNFIRMSQINREILYAKANIFFNYNSDVLLFDMKGNVYCLSDNYDSYKLETAYKSIYREQKWYSKLTSDELNVLWTAPFYYGIKGLDEKAGFISATRTIKSDYSNKLIGIIMVNIGEEYFRKFFEMSSAKGGIALINETQDVIFSSDIEFARNLGSNSIVFNSESGYYFETINKKKYMVNYYNLDRFGWVLIHFDYYDEVMKDLKTLKYNIYFLNTGIFFVFLILCMVLILYITNPLKKTINRLRTIKIGNYSVSSDEDYFNDDMNVMNKSIDYMINRIEELVKLVIAEQKAKSRLKYEALRAQINPHFLFNTLNIIKWSAKMSGATHVSKMIASLGKLLETSMNKGDDEITFREELELINAYMFIQNTRYNGAFTLNIDVPDDILDMKVLKLILQPIVENSIIHGFDTLKPKNIITIKAVKYDTYIKLTVTDNGHGIDAKKLREITEGIEIHDTKSRFSSIGLKNVADRIKLEYGNGYTLEIDSIIEEGTTVSLILPIIIQKG